MRGVVAAHTFDETADVVVVGSGAAGLTAALSAAVGGARVIVLEKAGVLGGTTAMSGAGVWIPANHHMLAAGLDDSPEEALTYLRATAPPGWHNEEEALWQAFAAHAPPMLALLEAQTPLRFELVQYPDLYPDAPGGKARGRMLSPLLLHNRLAGPFRNRIRRSPVPRSLTFRDVNTGAVLRAPLRFAAAMAPRVLWRMLTGQVGMGNALVVGLVKGCLDHGCDIRAGASAQRLTTEQGSGRVIGVAARSGGRDVTIRARRGVVLATGGFEWDAALREQYFPGPVGLIGSPRTNTGDGHRMAVDAGGVLARMDQANVFPATVTRYEGEPHAFPLNELSPPHCILVNRLGRRFVSEGAPNPGIALDARDVTGHPIHLPVWRIFDAQFAARNPLAMWLGRRQPGWFRQEPTISALAQAIGLDPDALAATIARFNGFVRNGKDEDFGRGETAWEKLTAPPAQGGNPYLGAIEQPPFYAAPCHRVILGTKGGPRTNARGQALRADGSVIAGLYCAGLTAANPIGTKAVGAGTTLGPCLTSGYICGLDLGRAGEC
jgi:3-oxosteroid 1-dehydrogenase